MIVDDIALTLQPRVGVKTAAHLLSHFGTATKIFQTTTEELIEVAQLSRTIAEQIPKKQYHKQAEREIEFCKKNGITPLSSTSNHYPPLLRECNDYPHVIYFKGNPEILSRRMISIVGTRRMTNYGQRVCESLVAKLGEMFPDLIIVSGLAFGVDAACHRSALNNGLATIGVIANRFPEINPTQHRMLAEQMIEQGGGVLTEYHSQNKDKGVAYTPRNRIIAGMSHGTVVVESPMKSGSMITANMADGYNRSVMSVPGRVDDFCSAGTNWLIKSQRAVLVRSAMDIADELGWKDGRESEQWVYDPTTLGESATRIYEMIKDGEAISIDQLAEDANLSIAELTPLLFELEIDGAIRVLPGKRYEKA